VEARREAKLSRVPIRLETLRGAFPGPLAALLALQAAPGPGDVLDLLPAVTARELEAHVRYLASDDLAGRATGTPGAERAAAYLARILARSGVEPAGDDGTFLQGVHLQRAQATSAAELTLVPRSEGPGTERIRAEPGRDFDPPGMPIRVQDLKVIVAAAPEAIPKAGDPGSAIFVDALDPEARRWLEAAGHSRGAGFRLWIRAGSKSAGEPRPFRPGKPGPLTRAEEGNRATPTVKIRGPLLERLRRGEIASISLDAHVEERAETGFNVVGRIPGAGLAGTPELAREALVLSAHYDHLPPRSAPPSGQEEEDRIFNGADDDASGCAAVLEIAGALGAGRKPARTVIFLLATAEEVGLLGTEAYLDRPVVPLDRTVANVNLEMIGRPDPLAGGPGKLWLTGFERTDLGQACVQAGIPVVPDPRPDEHFFERSDNYAFVRRGVIGQSFSTYNMHADYHHPSDEADTLDYAHLETCSKTVLEAVRLVADGKLRPRWTEPEAPKPAEPR